MSDPFLGEVRMIGFNYAPRGWAFCNGQTVPLSQYTALFAILGINFGGDGKNSFGLPNLQGSTPLGAGSGTGLSSYKVGQTGGTTTVTLQPDQIPAHTHQMMSASGRGTANSNAIGNNSFAKTATATTYAPSGNQTQMSGSALQSIGGGGAHNNMMPYLTVNFIIALQGEFPLRS